MLTRRVGIVYTFLFLFAFTFALSFTLASKAQAWGPPCCVYETCPPPFEQFTGIQGHWGLDFYGRVTCYFWPGWSTCDIWCECPNQD